MASADTRPEVDAARKLQGFDAWMRQVRKDWNAPAVGVAVVVGEQVVFVRGYGYRDYALELPFTPRTVVPIASNTKLFTAVAAGLLVAEGKLHWDRPVRESSPEIRFHNDALDTSVTLRDMLAHRTGISRHDSIWYRSSFTRRELFERIRHLEPSAPIRQGFLYNNLMYAGVGHLIELRSGQPWEAFVRERILRPLSMDSTVFSIDELRRAPEHGVPYTEKRDSFEIHAIPYAAELGAIGPAGSLNSNLEDMSRWLIALMNEGRFQGRQVLPAEVLAATLEPAIAEPNDMGERYGYWERLQPAYGMGREIAVYRGHPLTYHGGDIDGFHTQVSFMPLQKIGVLVFVIGDHCAPLYDIVGYQVYERLLGLRPTPWSERLLQVRLKAKAAATAARAKAGQERVPDTRPSHALPAYAGEYEHPAYGIVRIEHRDEGLQLQFHGLRLPLLHFHYDRFDSPDDEREGRWSVNFATDPQGEIASLRMSLDEGEHSFTRRPPALAAELLARLAGSYETATGAKFSVVLKPDGGLYLAVAGAPEQLLLPYRGTTFRSQDYADTTWEFVLEDGAVTTLKRRDPGGESLFRRR